MSHGQPCNHCGFEKSYLFLAYVHSTAFSLFFSNNPNSKPEKFKKRKRKKKKRKRKKKEHETEIETETHESKGTKPRN